MRFIAASLAAAALTLGLAAPPGAGTAGHRAQSIHDALTGAVAPQEVVPTPETAPEPTFTTVPAQILAPMVESRSVTFPAPAALAATTTTIAPLEVAKQGHYACTGEDNDTVECVNDEDGSEVTPSHGDQPGSTLGSTNPDYAARLDAAMCEAKPWSCD